MTSKAAPRGALMAGFAVLLLAVAAVFWLPRWWENRLYRQAEKIAGVGARVLPGSAIDARKKIDSGMSSDRMIAAIGRPSLSVRTEGTSNHEIWTYYYADGTMTVNLSDGVVKRIALDLNPPKIPTSARR